MRGFVLVDLRGSAGVVVRLAKVLMGRCLNQGHVWSNLRLILSAELFWKSEVKLS